MSRDHPEGAWVLLQVGGGPPGGEGPQKLQSKAHAESSGASVLLGDSEPRGEDSDI